MHKSCTILAMKDLPGKINVDVRRKINMDEHCDGSSLQVLDSVEYRLLNIR